MADRRRSSLKNPEPSTLYARPHGNVTMPKILLPSIVREATGNSPKTTSKAATPLCPLDVDFVEKLLDCGAVR
jgi:hypothetical protein